MRLKRLGDRSGCAVEVTLSVIGRVWKPVILLHLLPEKKCLMELTRLVPNTTQRMLTLQLHEFEANDVITRHVYPQVSSGVEYTLIPPGGSLVSMLISLREWDESYRTNEISREPAALPQCTRVEAMMT